MITLKKADFARIAERLERRAGKCAADALHIEENSTKLSEMRKRVSELRRAQSDYLLAAEMVKESEVPLLGRILKGES